MKKLYAVVDPLGAFQHVQKERLLAAGGLLPNFAFEAIAEEPSGDAETIYKLMVSIYGFGDFRHSEGTVSPEGVYSYPEDPDLDPIIKVSGELVDVFIYQHAILAVRDKDTTIITRMD